MSQRHFQPSWEGRVLGSHLAEGYIFQTFLLKGSAEDVKFQPSSESTARLFVDIDMLLIIIALSLDSRVR